MKAKVEIDVLPFTVPNFVRLGVEGSKSTAIPLSRVDRGTLELLCDRFRAEVFERADRPDDEGDEPS